MKKPAFCANCTRTSAMLAPHDWDGRTVWLCWSCRCGRVADPPEVQDGAVARVVRVVQRFDAADTSEVLFAIGIDVNAAPSSSDRCHDSDVASVYQALSRAHRRGLIRAERERGDRGYTYRPAAGRG